MKRKIFSAEFKSKVAMEAIKDNTTIAEISKKYEVHPTQITHWKTIAIQHFPDMFGDEKTAQKQALLDKKSQDRIEILERKIGQLIIENDFLKKNWENYLQRKDAK